MKKTLYILTAISCILYYTAPKEYSYTFSVLCLCVYLLSAFVLLKNNCKESFLKFETIFLISFFFTNIVYSVFYFPTNPYFILFSLPFNENYINRGLALSVMGACFFCLGVYEKKHFQKDIQRKNYYTPKISVTILLVVFIIYQITLVRLHSYTTEFTSSFLNSILVYLVYYVMFNIFYQYRTENKHGRFAFISNNLLIFFLFFIYISLFLVIGSRTIPLSMLLLTIFLYDAFIHKIGLRTIVVMLFFGTLLMLGVSVYRAHGDYNYEINSFLDLGIDLTINNRSLYVLMEYADINGITYGQSELLSIFAAIPYGQRFIIAFTGWDINKLNSARLVTSLYFDNEGIHQELFGLGTNLIGDIYVAFGTIGVIALMYLLGRLLRHLWERKLNGEMIAYFLYAMIFIEAIYITRAAYFEWLRNIAWGMFWFVIINGFILKKQETL